MKRYSFFHAPVLAFFSKSFYQDVGQHWRGTGLAYLLVILALLWIPTMVRMQFGIVRFVDSESKPFTEQVPAITITKGQVSTNVTTPYFIKDPKTGTDLAIIDTTGEYTTLENTNAKILLTKTKLIASQSATETRTYDLAGVESFYVDRNRVQGWLVTGKTWFTPIAYLAVLLGSFVFRAIQVLIYALIGLLFAHLLQTSLSYKTLMRLAAVAITPVIVLDLILEFLPIHIPLWSLLGIVIGLSYLFLAVKANTEVEPALPEPSPWARPAATP